MISVKNLSSCNLNFLESDVSVNATVCFPLKISLKKSIIFNFSIAAPKNADEQDILKSVVRVTGIETDLENDEEIEIQVIIQGDKEYESILKTNYKKKVIRNNSNLSNDVHLNFNNTIKALLKVSRNIEITLKTSKEVQWNKLAFTLFTEKV